MGRPLDALEQFVRGVYAALQVAHQPHFDLADFLDSDCERFGARVWFSSFVLGHHDLPIVCNLKAGNNRRWPSRWTGARSANGGAGPARPANV
jgi:hypothetical protein